MKHISIITTQNVTIRYELANARDRALATLIDFGVMLVCWGLLALLFNLLDFNAYYSNQVIFVLILCYHLISEISMNGQSLGKRAMGLRVLKINGLVPAWTDYVLRWAFRIIDVSFSLGSVAVMSISSSESGQRFGDLFAGTTVVRLHSSYAVDRERLEGVRTQTDGYQAKYPEVMQLTDEDLLTVKAILGRSRQYKKATYLQLLEQSTAQLCERLHIEPEESDQQEFLKQILEDYIVLKR